MTEKMDEVSTELVRQRQTVEEFIAILQVDIRNGGNAGLMEALDKWMKIVELDSSKGSHAQKVIKHLELAFWAYEQLYMQYKGLRTAFHRVGRRT